MKDLNDLSYTISLLKSLNESNLDYLDDLRQSKDIEYDFNRLQQRIYNLELLANDLLTSLEGDVMDIQQQEFKREVD